MTHIIGLDHSQPLGWPLKSLSQRTFTVQRRVYSATNPGRYIDFGQLLRYKGHTMTPQVNSSAREARRLQTRVRILGAAVAEFKAGVRRPQGLNLSAHH